MSTRNEEYGFLKKKPFKDHDVDYDELVTMLEEEIKDVENFDPDLDEEETLEEAKIQLKSELAKRNKGGTTSGKFVGFGLPEIFNYVESWKRTQLNAYKKVYKGEGPAYVKIDNEYVEFNTPKEMVDAGLIALEKGTKKAIALDKRKKDKRIPYPESSWSSNLLGTWNPKIDKKKHLIDPFLGGEIDDTATNPECSKCGSVGWERTCKAKHDGVVCNTKREGFLVPDIIENAGKVFTITLGVKVKDKKIDEVNFKDGITKIGKGKPLPIRHGYVKENGKIKRDENGDGIKEISGLLAEWIPDVKDPNFNEIKSSDLAFWKDDKAMVGKKSKAFWKKYGDKYVMHVANIYSMSERERKRATRCRTYWGMDSTTTKDDDGIKYLVPRYVFLYNVRNVFGEKSDCIVIGKLEREGQYDFKEKKKVTTEIEYKGKDGKRKKKTVQLYNKPSIKVSCIIPIKIKEPEPEIPEIPEGETEVKIPVKTTEEKMTIEAIGGKEIEIEEIDEIEEIEDIEDIEDIEEGEIPGWGTDD
jgi:hypothetical protein